MEWMHKVDWKQTLLFGWDQCENLQAFRIQTEFSSNRELTSTIKRHSTMPNNYLVMNLTWRSVAGNNLQYSIHGKNQFEFEYFMWESSLVEAGNVFKAQWNTVLFLFLLCVLCSMNNMHSVFFFFIRLRLRDEAKFSNGNDNGYYRNLYEKQWSKQWRQRQTHHL